jgi:hypothetical protein
MKNLDDAFPEIVQYLIDKGAKKLCHGRHRAVMCRGNVVYKIPYNNDGVQANFEEDYIFHKKCKSKEMLYPHHYRKDTFVILGFARCRMIYLQGFPILMMERLSVLERDSDSVTNVMDMIDGGQFGIGKRRNDFLCYDYSRTTRRIYDTYPADLRETFMAFTSKFGNCVNYAGPNGFEECFGAPKESLTEFVNNS